MLSNIKFKAIEDLKNLRADEGEEKPEDSLEFTPHLHDAEDEEFIKKVLKERHSIKEGLIRQSTNNPKKKSGDS